MDQNAHPKEVVCDVMANPLVHALVFAIAVIIPGGLLVYFAWRAIKKSKQQKAAKLKMIEARKDFIKHFPVQSDSLRAGNRLNRLAVYRTRPRRKPPE